MKIVKISDANIPAENEFAVYAPTEISVNGIPDGYDYGMESRKVMVKFNIDIEYRDWGIQDIGVTIPEQTAVMDIVLKDIDDNEEHIQVQLNVHEIPQEIERSSQVTVDRLVVSMVLNPSTKQITVDYKNSSIVIVK